MTLLLVLSLCVQDMDQARSAMEQACAEAHADLGKWCERQKLHADARRHYEESLKYKYDSATRKKVEGDLPEDAPKNAEKAAKNLQKKEESLLKALVKAWSNYAKTLTKLKEPRFAKYWWAKVLAAQPKNKVASRSLGKKFDMKYFETAEKFEYDRSEFEDGGDGRYDRAVLHYTELIPTALAEIEKMTGLVWKDGVPLKIHFSNEKAAGTGQLAATTVDTDNVVIKVTVQNWTSNRPKDSFQFNVTHELLHAVQGSQMGLDGYRSCPPWFHEGLAEYTSGGGPNMVKYALETQQNNLNGILDGLETDSSSALGADDYAEGYLAIRYLREKLKAESFDEMLNDIFAKKVNVTDAVLERTGETWEQFQKSVHSFARKRYRQILKEAKPTGK